MLTTTCTRVSFIFSSQQKNAWAPSATKVPRFRVLRFVATALVCGPQVVSSLSGRGHSLKSTSLPLGKFGLDVASVGVARVAYSFDPLPYRLIRHIRDVYGFELRERPQSCLFAAREREELNAWR